MVPEKNNHQRIGRLLKDEPIRQTGAAFENPTGQFADANPAMNMRVAESRAQLKQGENGGDSFAFRQPAQPF
jgi:hypothetical protein